MIMARFGSLGAEFNALFAFGAGSVHDGRHLEACVGRLVGSTLPSVSSASEARHPSVAVIVLTDRTGEGDISDECIQPLRASTGVDVVVVPEAPSWLSPETSSVADPEALSEAGAGAGAESEFVARVPARLVVAPHTLARLVGIAREWRVGVVRALPAGATGPAPAIELCWRDGDPDRERWVSGLDVGVRDLAADENSRRVSLRRAARMAVEAACVARRPDAGRAALCDCRRASPAWRPQSVALITRATRFRVSPEQG